MNPDEVRRTPYRGTKVSLDSSQSKVRSLMRKYGVEDIQFTYRAGQIIRVVFAKADQVGHMDAYEVQVAPLTPDEQGDRQAMRMLFYWLKTMLETIEFGIADFETLLLPYRLVASENGRSTLAEIVLPQMRAGGTDVDPFRPALPVGRG